MDINLIYSKHYQYVFNYIHGKIANVSVCQEIANDTFIKANKHLAEFDENRAKLTTWLITIAKNSIIDYFRYEKDSKTLKVSDFVDTETGKEFFTFVADTQADTRIENKELLKGIKIAFDGLKPDYKRIAVLYFIQQMEYAEIANMLNVPMGTVKGMISRCRTMLQEKLQREKILYGVK